MLELRDIRYARDQGWSLVFESLRVLPGQLVTVAGPNGAGKSTLLRIMSLHLRPDRGAIVYCGADALRERGAARELRRNLILVHQHPFLFDGSVFDNVAYGLRLRKVRGQTLHARVDEALERVGLGDFRRRSARELSGGESQRVAIARALALHPQVLLLDEPTAAVDVENAERIEHAVTHRSWVNGATVVITTHSVGRMQLRADAEWVLVHGRLVEGPVSAAVGRNGSVSAAPVQIRRSRPEGTCNGWRAGTISALTSDGAAVVVEFGPGQRCRLSRAQYDGLALCLGERVFYCLGGEDERGDE